MTATCLSSYAESLTLEEQAAVVLLQAVSQAQRDEAVSRGLAFSDGSYPILNAVMLKAAIRLVGKSTSHSYAAVKAHIVKCAKKLGLSRLLPDDWMTQEDAPVDPVPDIDPALIQTEIQATLLLEALAEPQILQEGTEENGGVMRVKVPFYVGGSLARAPGIPRRIYFGPGLLTEIVQEGNRDIKGPQPLTVYPRHAQAIEGRDLPCGRVAELEHDGRIGYAVMEIAPTTAGKDVQVLMQHKHINAVSLRSRKYKLVNGKVQGENVFVAEGLRLSGLDFAPDSPAQATYGIEILNEDVRLEADAPPEPPTPTPPTTTRSLKLDEITLDDLKRDAPQVVQEIERPLRDQITALTQERNSLVQERDTTKVENATLHAERNARELDAYIESIAQRTTDPAKFRAEFTALCQEKGIKTVGDASPHAMPLVLRALDTARTAPAAPVEPQKTREELLAEMFPTPGRPVADPAAPLAPPAPAVTAGNGVVEPGQPTDGLPVLTQEQREYRSTVGGLLMPEG